MFDNRFKERMACRVSIWMTGQMTDQMIYSGGIFDWYVD